MEPAQKTPKLKVCLYCRVSTSGQELTQQIDSCKRFAEYKNLEVAKVYQDIGSGKNFNRPDFYKMLIALRHMAYGGIVVFRIDRLGRSVLDLANLLNEMERKGIQVFSVNENLDRTTAMGKLCVNMIFLMAEFERENISESVKQRLAAKREQYAIINSTKKEGEKLLKLGRPVGSKDAKKRKRSYFKKPKHGGVL